MGDLRGVKHRKENVACIARLYTEHALKFMAGNKMSFLPFFKDGS